VTSPTGTITAVIVSYDESPEQIQSAVEGLLGQTRPATEILVVDNGSKDRLPTALRSYPAVTMITPAANLGYAGGVNLAAKNAHGDYLLCVNPDARPAPDCLARLAAVADGDERIAIVGAQILLEDGSRRNAGANPLHPVGISPSGGYGEPIERGDPRDVIVVSGACCLIRRSAFSELNGFVDEFFMYYDDVDLGWRARMAGLRVVYCPLGVAMHGYDFGRRKSKWFYLERNRLFSILSNYETPTLLLLAPLLLATELGLLGVALIDGWLPQKLQGYRALFGLRRTLMTHRRGVQGSRQQTDAELFAFFDDRLDSALLPRSGALIANFFCVPYLRVVRRMVRRWNAGHPQGAPPPRGT
jgi:GT2 family glycosyltransferase